MANFVLSLGKKAPPPLFPRLRHLMTNQPTHVPFTQVSLPPESRQRDEVQGSENKKHPPATLLWTRYLA